MSLNETNGFALPHDQLRPWEKGGYPVCTNKWDNKWEFWVDPLDTEVGNLFWHPEYGFEFPYDDLDACDSWDHPWRLPIWDVRMEYNDDGQPWHFEFGLN